MSRATDFSNSHDKSNHAEHEEPDDSLDRKQPDAEPQNSSDHDPRETGEKKVHGRRIVRLPKGSSLANRVGVDFKWRHVAQDCILLYRRFETG